MDDRAVKWGRTGTYRGKCMCGGMYASDTEVSEEYQIEFKYLLERLSVVNTAGRSFFALERKFDRIKQEII